MSEHNFRRCTHNALVQCAGPHVGFSSIGRGGSFSIDRRVNNAKTGGPSLRFGDKSLAPFNACEVS